MQRSLVVLALLLGAGVAVAKSSAKVHTVAADQVQFKDAEGMPGVQVAQLWGDMRKAGDWGALIKFKAGTDVGWHTHTGGTHVVVVAGTLTVQGEGGEPTKLAAGAFASEPAKVPHATRCEEGADCVFLLQMKQKFDFKKAAEPKAAAR